MKLPGKGMSWKEFFKALKNEYQKDNISDAAGALTYFGVLALFPFLLFLVSLASVIINPQQAETLVQQLSAVAPPEVAGIIGGQLRNLAADSKVGLLSIGAVGALWAASGGVAAVMRALNTAYDVKESRPFWKTRGIAILFVLGGGALTLIATLAAIATPALANWVGGPLGTAIMWLRIPVAAVIVMFVWAVAYYVLPDVEQDFRFITPGSVVGVIIWIAASLGFSLYVSNFGKYDATYGSLGGVIVMLLWMWISAQVLLLGAEIIAIIEHKSPEGKDKGQKKLDEGTGAEPAHGGHAPSYSRRRAMDQRHGADVAHRVINEPARRSASASQGPLRRFGLTVWGAVVGAAAIGLLRRRAV